jgi:hypothetical protein
MKTVTLKNNFFFNCFLEQAKHEILIQNYLEVAKTTNVTKKYNLNYAKSFEKKRDIIDFLI